MKPLEFVFSVRNENFWKVFTILGVNFRFVNTRDFINQYKSFNFPKNMPKILSKGYLSFFSFIGTCDFVLKGSSKSDFNEIISNDLKILIKNLDDESKKTVENSILMLENYIEYRNIANPTFKDLKNLYEKVKESSSIEVQRRIYNEFSKKIILQQENVYSYNKYKLPINHFESSVFYYKHSINELTTLDKVRQKDILDVGGFIGDSALVFSDYTDKKIYTFEPLKENFELMQKTIELNNLTNVVPINMALGDKVSEVLNLCGAGSCVRIAPPPSATLSSDTSIEATTLDDFVAKNNIEVGLIKVDIEGYEQNFLKGAEQTIKTQKPALLLSIYHNLDDYLHIKPIIESWNLGYKFKIRKPEESYILETLLIAEVTE